MLNDKHHDAVIPHSPKFAQTAYILTFNFAARYDATSRDFGVVDRTSGDVSAVEQAFAADWADREITPSAGAGLVWSPGATSEQVAFIDHARTASTSRTRRWTTRRSTPRSRRRRAAGSPCGSS